VQKIFFKNKQNQFDMICLIFEFFESNADDCIFR